MYFLEIDHSKTFVLLIGVSAFGSDSGLGDIPNVTANLRELKRVLNDPEIVGIPESQIFVCQDENKMDIERELIRVGRLANSSSLLVYYAGHGIIHEENFELFFAAAGTTKEYLAGDGINAKTFKEHLGASTAKRKILIVDACFSGQVHNQMSGTNSAALTILAETEGTYTITSTSQDKPALFPVNRPGSPTYFTGQLVETIQNGIGNNSPVCTIRDVFQETKRKLEELGGIPLPQESNFENAGDTPISYNRSYGVSPNVGFKLEFMDKIQSISKRSKRILILSLLIFGLAGTGLFFAIKNWAKVVGFEDDLKILVDNIGTDDAIRIYEKYYGKGAYQLNHAGDLPGKNARTNVAHTDDTLLIETDKSPEVSHYREENMYLRARLSDTREAIGLYLDSFPSGKYKVDAVNQLRNFSIKIGNDIQSGPNPFSRKF